jgi:hypothetical protein
VSEYTLFPKELQRDWFGELDKRFLTIFLITLFVHVASLVYLQGVQWAQMTEADVGKYLDAIYRVTPAKITPSERMITTLQTGASEVAEETGPVEETAAPVAKAAKSVKRRGSGADLAAKRASMQASARSMGIFRLAGAQQGAGGAGTSGTGGSGVARGLKAGGGLGGVEVSKIAGIATGSMADKVEKARGGTRITEGTGGIDIAQLSDAQIEDILSSSTVEIAALPEVEGLASKNANRSGASIRGIADANVHLVKNCYNRYKRKDVNLKGKVKVEWSIEPDGRVSRVKILNSEWTRPPLGRRVEDCLTEVIGTWLFEPIPQESGKVRAAQTYIFD